MIRLGHGQSLAFIAMAMIVRQAIAQAPAQNTEASSGQLPASSPPWMRDPEKVHDPSSMMQIDGGWRFFGTGMGVSIYKKNADDKWLSDGRIFEKGGYPAWHEQLVPGNRGYLWAPDVIKVENRYFVYYSVSTFGKNTSAIGLAVGDSLDPASKNWKWEDRGVVFQSKTSDPYNAIDPALFRDPKDQRLWMSFGSFWKGIHLVELDTTTGLRSDREGEPIRLATAPEIEAPYLYFRQGWYYLFVNWGKCCRGTESTYEIRVGRSRSVTGPYIDKEGRDLREQGGSLLLDSEGRWIGPGHASIISNDGQDQLVHHFYDGENRGRSRLRLIPLKWTPEEWAEVVNGS